MPILPNQTGRTSQRASDIFLTAVFQRNEAPCRRRQGYQGRAGLLRWQNVEILLSTEARSSIAGRSSGGGGGRQSWTAISATSRRIPRPSPFAVQADSETQLDPWLERVLSVIYGRRLSFTQRQIRLAALTKGEAPHSPPSLGGANGQRNSAKTLPRRVRLLHWRIMLQPWGRRGLKNGSAKRGPSSRPIVNGIHRSRDSSPTMPKKRHRGKRGKWCESSEGLVHTIA